MKPEILLILCFDEDAFPKKNGICARFEVFHSGTADDSRLRGCDALPLGSGFRGMKGMYCLPFRPLYP